MPSPPAINAAELSQHPVLTLHKIFDDLPRTSILALASCNNPHITACILTHATHSQSFPTAAALDTACAYYALLRATAAHQGHTLRTTPIIDHAGPYSHARVHAHTVRELDALSPNDARYFQLFDPPASNVWNSSTLPHLQERFAAIRANGPRLQAQKRAQVLRIHAVREAHAGRLKARLDPSQEPRPRQQPLLDRLRRQRKMLEPDVPRERAWTNGVYGPKVWMYLGRWIPVPYDRYLVMLLKVLRRYPLPDEAMPGVTVPGVRDRRWRVMGVRPVPVVPEYFDGEESYTVEAGGKGTAGKEEEGGAAEKDAAGVEGAKKIKYLYAPKRSHTHIYPPSAVSNVRTALLGLKYTYTVPGVAARPRTMYTPYSAPESQMPAARNLQPCFAVPEGNEPLAYAVNDKEIEWLEAFLACCDYMSTMEETWLDGVTVAEWWKSRDLGCR